MKKYRFLFLLLSPFLLGACADDDTPGNLEPRLSATEATAVTRNEAVFNGTVTLQGSTAMPALCFVYGTSADLSLSSTELTPQDGKVSWLATGLTAGTDYYYALRATRGNATVTSNVMTFTTLPNDMPTVGTLSVLSHGPTSVIVEFPITDTGGEPISVTGCYVTEEGTDSSQKVLANYDEAEGAGVKLRVGNLKQHTTYALEPFAANREGERRGAQINFTTTDAIVLGVAGELATLLGDEGYVYESLSFAGYMDGDDLRCLRQLMGRNADGTTTAGHLTQVDLTDVMIVEGGGTYGSSRYSQENVVSYGLFADCDNLLSVTLPDSVVTIEENAFLNCSSLRQVTIPAAAHAIGTSVGCVSLQEILVSEANDTYRSIDGVLFNATATEVVWFPMGKTGDYVLPATVTAIGDYAFRECGITRFTLPDNLSRMGRGAFYGSKVEEVTLPDNLETIPTATFQHCANLTTVRIGKQAALVSDYVFDGCPLADLYVTAPTPPVCNDNAFSSTSGEDITATCVLHVPSESRQIYGNHSRWGKFATIKGE